MTPIPKSEPALARWPGTFLAGSLLGRRFKVQDFLIEGGMALVFRGIEPATGAEVVIKTPRSGLLANPDFRGRFLREGRLVVEFSNPHVVPVLDLGEHDNRPFLVLAYMPGGSLREHLVAADGAPRAYTPAALSKWLAPVAAALDAIYAAGYIHRDVKPDNILFDAARQPRLTDFGIAKAVGAAATNRTATVATVAGYLIGTPLYMAPELLLEQPADGRADQFALAVTVYEFLTGQIPFPGANGNAVSVCQRTTTDDQLRVQLSTRLAPGVYEAVIRGLQRNPARRFPSSAEFARHVLAGLGAGAMASGPVRTPTLVESPGDGRNKPPPFPAGGPGYTRVEPLPLDDDDGDDEPPRRRRPEPLPIDDELEMEPSGPLIPRWLTRFVLWLVLLAVLVGGLGAAGWYGWGYMNHRLADRAATRSEQKIAEGDYDLALSDAERAVKYNPKSARAFLARGVAKQRMLDFHEALDDFDKAIELDPNLAAAYLWRCQIGLFLADMRDRDYSTEQATKDVAEALRIDPKLPSAVAMRGLIYAQGKSPDFEQALKACQDAIELKADDPWVFAIRAEVRSRKADTMLTRSDRVAPQKESPEARTARRKAVAEQMKEEEDKARADATRAAEYGRGEAAYYRFIYLCRNADEREHEKEVDQFARDYTNHPYSHLLTAIKHLGKKESDQAINAAREHLKIYPGSFFGYTLLVSASAQKKNTDTTETLATEAIQKLPKSAILRMIRGRFRHDRGDFAKAREDLDEAIRLNPANGLFYFLRADIRRKLGDTAGADADEKKAKELDPLDQD